MPGHLLEIFAARISTLALYESGQVGDRSCQIGTYSNTKQGSITCFLEDVLVCGYAHVFRPRSLFPRVSTRMYQTFGTGLFEAYIRRYFQWPIWPITGQSSELWAPIRVHLLEGPHGWLDRKFCCLRYAHLAADFRLALPVVESENANWVIQGKSQPLMLLCLDDKVQFSLWSAYCIFCDEIFCDGRVNILGIMSVGLDLLETEVKHTHPPGRYSPIDHFQGSANK